MGWVTSMKVLVLRGLQSVQSCFHLSCHTETQLSGSGTLSQHLR